MKNTFGNSVSVTLFGESHGEAIGAVLDGIAPGIPVDAVFIQKQLDKRRSLTSLSTPRREKDDFQIVSGVFRGKTTGTPITFIIENRDTDDSLYNERKDIPRPGHADYTNRIKYHGFEDYRGGGHSSGRITAALTAAGAVALSMLKYKNIKIGTHIFTLGNICDRRFEDITEDIDALNKKIFPVLDAEKADEMQKAIKAVNEAGDSWGGILETAVIGLPAGVGEPWFDSVEGCLSHAVFSIPGVKGIAFGDAFSATAYTGSQYNDGFYMDGNNVKTLTNHNGGINGGITNGMPLIFRSAVKPTPSVSITQHSVNLSDNSDTLISVGGRHDPAFIHRLGVVIDSVTALTLCDLLSLRYGTDWQGF